MDVWTVWTWVYLYRNNFEKDIKTVEEVLQSSSKAVRLKYSLVQIPVHVCSTHCPPWTVYQPVHKPVRVFILSANNVQNNRACLASSIGLAYCWLFCSTHTHSAHERLVALTLNLVSVQPCAGQENNKREKVEIIIFREIKVPGNIPVIQ